MSLSDSTAEAERLLLYLKQHRGFDFTGYKRVSLMRRIGKRMQATGFTSYADYIDYLEVNPDEFAQLFNTILINVTSFFRDVSAWEYLADEVLPRILSRKTAGEPIRVWSAGCASGEEAYSIAVLLTEALGVEATRERVKIYATDVDEEALAKARAASFSAKDVTGVPKSMLERYFEHSDGRYVFRKELRRTVIFGRNDLIQDAPISRIDLLICRNTLMYFNSETQARILARFHFALDEAGFLFLGRAEMISTHGSTFTPADLKRRIFNKVPRLLPHDGLLSGDRLPREEGFSSVATHVRLREAAFDASPVANVVIDLHGVLSIASDRARALFGLTARDIGRPIKDLEISYRPADLRSAMEQAYAERRSVTLSRVLMPSSTGESRWLDILVAPLQDAADTPLGMHISFADVTRFKLLQDRFEQANQELETAYEELETTNEELNSTVEELETTNEELQSTNEELETMNEELQSTNEELQSINDEASSRSAELNRVNSFLNGILTSVQSAVIALDEDLRVLIWNRHAEELWGLRDTEAQGKNLLLLDIGLPVEQLKQRIRACLVGQVDVERITLAATNRRGRPIECRITCTPLQGPQGGPTGVILLME